MHMSHKDASALAVGPIVVKYGGSIAGAAHTSEQSRSTTCDVLAEIADLWHAGTAVVLVHGGGPEIDVALAARGIVTQRIDGLRVTDATTLEITEAALCGTLNKRIVRACAALGLPAAGISGQDGGLLIAQRAVTADGGDLGYVGEIVATDPRILHLLLEGGFLPVVAPLATACDGNCAYNVNADLAAAAIAGALRASAFVAVTNVPRVFRDPDDPSSGIDRFSLREAGAFAAGDGCRSSMKPKLNAAIAAVTGGAHASYICDAKPGAIRSALAGDATVIAA